VGNEAGKGAHGLARQRTARRGRGRHRPRRSTRPPPSSPPPPPSPARTWRACSSPAPPRCWWARCGSASPTPSFTCTRTTRRVRKREGGEGEGGRGREGGGGGKGWRQRAEGQRVEGQPRTLSLAHTHNNIIRLARGVGLSFFLSRTRTRPSRCTGRTAHAAPAQPSPAPWPLPGPSLAPPRAPPGTGVATQLAAAAAGADIVDCCADSMSGLTSQPSMGAIVNALAGTPLDTGIKPELLLPMFQYWCACGRGCPRGGAAGAAGRAPACLEGGQRRAGLRPWRAAVRGRRALPRQGAAHVCRGAAASPRPCPPAPAFPVWCAGSRRASCTRPSSPT
jgi:hypothetical protein